MAFSSGRLYKIVDLMTYKQLRNLRLSGSNQSAGLILAEGVLYMIFHSMFSSTKPLLLLFLSSNMPQNFNMY